MKSIVALAVVLLISVAHAGAETPTRLTDVAIAAGNDATTVTVKTGGAAKYHASLIDSRRLVVDFENTQYEWRKTPLAGNDPIKEIRGSQFRKGVARIVVQLSRTTPYSVEGTAEGIQIVLADAATKAPARIAAVKPEPAVAAASEPAKPEPAVAPAPEPVKAEPVTAEPVKAETPTVAIAPEPVKPETPAVAIAAEPVKPETPAVVSAPAPAAVATPAPAKTEPAPVAAPAPVKPAPVRVAQAQAPAPTPTPAPSSNQISVHNGRRLISLDFKDADVVNLLRILAAESGRNIVVGEDVKGKMSISLRNVPWEQALETILETRGLQAIEKGNVLRIVTVEQLTKEREAVARVEEAKLKSEADTRTKMAEAEFKEAEAIQRKMAAQAAAREAEARGPLREETVRLSYANPEEVAETLQGILGIPKEGQKINGAATLPGGAPLIAEPPFSQLYGQQQAPPPPPPVSVSQDVLVKGLSIRAHKATNTIFLRLYAADLERVKKLIRESFDIPLPQVKIEARMEILDRNALEQIGIQWGGGSTGRAGSLSLVGQGYQTSQNLGQTVAAAPGVVLPDGSVLLDRTPVQGLRSGNNALDLASLLPVSSSTGLPLGGNLINLPISALPNAGPIPAAGLAFGIVGTTFNVNLALQALAEQGKTRTLARPEIVTVENARAAMSLGEEIPYATVSSAGTQIQFKEALLKLEVTPTVIREGNTNKVKMMVIVENNSRGTVVNLGNSGNPPAINRRKAETQVLVREGERLVIGGVSTSTDSNTIRKVPVAGDIPIFGWLFKQKENFEAGRELVVFVTPSIIRTLDGSASSTPGPLSAK